MDGNVTPDVTRRGFISATIRTAAVGARARATQAATGAGASPPQAPEPLDIFLDINGNRVRHTIEPRTSLLDALRGNASLMGTKNGCDRGACGACTIHLDGRRVVSCLTLAARCQGKSITTIEGLDTTVLADTPAARRSHYLKVRDRAAAGEAGADPRANVPVKR